jgi:hypothetical protein
MAEIGSPAQRHSADIFLSRLKLDSSRCEYRSCLRMQERRVPSVLCHVGESLSALMSRQVRGARILTSSLPHSLPWFRNFCTVQASGVVTDIPGCTDVSSTDGTTAKTRHVFPECDGSRDLKNFIIKESAMNRNFYRRVLGPIVIGCPNSCMQQYSSRLKRSYRKTPRPLFGCSMAIYVTCRWARCTMASNTSLNATTTSSLRVRIASDRTN